MSGDEQLLEADFPQPRRMHVYTLLAKKSSAFAPAEGRVSPGYYSGALMRPEGDELVAPPERLLAHSVRA